jgi:hypothetical protein
MDLTKSLNDPANAAIRAVASTLDVILVVAACDALRPAYGPPDVDTVFFETLLPVLKVGAFLLFVEPQYDTPCAVEGLIAGNKCFVRAQDHPWISTPGVAGMELLQVRSRPQSMRHLYECDIIFLDIHMRPGGHALLMLHAAKHLQACAHGLQIRWPGCMHI